MSSLSISNNLPHGYQLGDYIIQRPLAQDAAGITYLAACGFEERAVFIREHLPSGLLQREPGRYRVQPVADVPACHEAAVWAQARFVEEAETLKGIDHPNLPKVEAVFQELGTAYYVQKHVEGVALGTWAEAHGAPDKEALRGMLTALLGALGALHAGTLPQGEALLHTALDPGAIIVTADGTPMLTGFGYARTAIAKSMGAPCAGAPGYTPFELLQPHGKTGPWSDIYALGATFYSLLTGTVPADCQERLSDEDDPLAPLASNPELVARYGKPLLESIDKAMSPKRSQRWQSAQEWQTALAAIPRETPLPRKAAPAKPVHAEKEAKAEKAAAAPAGEPKEPEKRKRKLLVWLTMVLVLLAGLGVGGYYYFQKQEQPTQQALDLMLAHAIRKGDKQAAEYLLAHGANPNALDLYGESPIMERHDAEWVKLCLDNGMDPNMRIHDGRTLLHRGVDKETMELLLSKGADINAKDNLGRTPLHNCIWLTEDTTLLLDHGADINARDDRGITPLHLAASQPFSLKPIELLLDRGAYINAMDDEGRTALYWAAFSDYQEVVDLLTRHNAAGDTELASTNHRLVVTALCGWISDIGGPIIDGAQINTSDTNGKTPLMEAAKAGQDETAWYLLNDGADVNAKDNRGDTALHMAGNGKVAELLLKHGADIKAVDNSGMQPIHRLAERGEWDAVRLLVSRGADPYTKDKYGRTLLHVAHGGNEVFLALLPDLKQLINLKDKYGKTPLHGAAASADDDIIRALIDKGADVNAKDAAGLTPLHDAAWSKSLKTIQLLLDNGADINAKDGLGQTPLHEAVGAGHTETAGMLLDNGADINAKDKLGRTPLDIAKKGGPAEMVDLLESKGRR